MSVKVEVEVPKELNDVRVAVVSVVADIKAGKPLLEVAGGNLQKLNDAISGADKIPDELKAELAGSIALAGLMGGEVLAELLKKSPAPASA